MSRPRTFTDGRFKREVRKASTVLEVATALGVSTVTVYNHLRRLGLPPPKREIKPLDVSVELFEEYTGEMTIAKLAMKFRMSEGAVRHRLKQAAIFLWKTGHMSDYPMPTAIGEIRIINELQQSPDLINDPETLAKITRTSLSIITNFLHRVFEHQTKKGTDENDDL